MSEIKGLDNKHNVLFSLKADAIYNSVKKHRELLSTLSILDEYSPTIFSQDDLDGIMSDLEILILQSKSHEETTRVYGKLKQERKSIKLLVFNAY